MLTRTTRRLGAPLACILLSGLAADLYAAPKKGGGTSLAGLIRAIQADGEESSIRPNIAPLLNIAPNAPSKDLAIEPPGEAKRTFEKSARLVMERDPATDKLRPVSILIFDSYTTKDDTGGRMYKASLDGRLQTAVDVLVVMGSDGKAVRGSGKKTDLDIASPQVKAAFQKELDFWISGKFRKHWKPKAAAKQD